MTSNMIRLIMVADEALARALRWNSEEWTQRTDVSIEIARKALKEILIEMAQKKPEIDT